MNTHYGMTYAFPIYASLKHITGATSNIKDSSNSGVNSLWQQGLGVVRFLLIDKYYN